MQYQNKSGRKVALGSLALAGAAVVIVGVGYAYFSDVITGGGTATAGTLDIDGTISLTQNGTAAGTTITNFNPGDIIGITASDVTNSGSKSAWIRATFEFDSISALGGTCSDTQYLTESDCTTNSGTWTAATTGNLADYLWVCPSSATQAALISASTTAADAGARATALEALNCEKAVAGSVLGTKTTYTAPADVISGTAETDGAATTWTPAGLSNIYFDAAATNDAQQGTAAFSVLIQALQYRNNTTSPTEAQWDTVVDAPFSLN